MNEIREESRDIACGLASKLSLRNACLYAVTLENEGYYIVQSYDHRLYTHGFDVVKVYSFGKEYTFAQDEEQDSEQDDSTKFCPQCDGYSYSMGALGAVQYYRCQYCGWTFRA